MKLWSTLALMIFSHPVMGQNFPCHNIRAYIPASCHIPPKPTSIAIRVNDFFESLDTFEEMVSGSSKKDLASLIPDCQKDVQQAALSWLESYIDKLKSFSHERHFDFGGFESCGRELRDELLAFAKVVKSMDFDAGSVNTGHDFAKKMFLAMSLSIDYLKYYETSQSPGHSLLRDVIDLNVGLFRLYDYDGKPDANNKHLSAQISRFSGDLQFLKLSISSNREISFGALAVFQKFYSRAGKELQFLKGFVASQD